MSSFAEIMTNTTRVVLNGRIAVEDINNIIGKKISLPNGETFVVKDVIHKPQNNIGGILVNKDSKYSLVALKINHSFDEVETLIDSYNGLGTPVFFVDTFLDINDTIYALFAIPNIVAPNMIDIDFASASAEERKGWNSFILKYIVEADMSPIGSLDIYTNHEDALAGAVENLILNLQMSAVLNIETGEPLFFTPGNMVRLLEEDFHIQEKYINMALAHIQ